MSCSHRYSKELRFAWRFFHHGKPTRYGLWRVHAVHENSQQDIFEAHLSLLELERKHQVQEEMITEPHAEQRRALPVMQHWDDATRSFPFMDFQTVEPGNGRNRTSICVRVLPMWLGSSAAVCEAICENALAMAMLHNKTTWLSLHWHTMTTAVGSKITSPQATPFHLRLKRQTWDAASTAHANRASKRGLTSLLFSTRRKRWCGSGWISNPRQCS